MLNRLRPGIDSTIGGIARFHDIDVLFFLSAGEVISLVLKKAFSRSGLKQSLIRKKIFAYNKDTV
jgi:hypothetical protein